jgi:DNA polymerase-3 subunit beta
MHVHAKKKDLLRVLGRCQAVADKKSTMPVLGNVLLETNGTDQLRLAATDLVLGVNGEVAARVDKPGSVALGARDLYERMRMMPDGEVSIEATEGATTTIRAAASARRYTVHGIPGEEFPALPAPDQGTTMLELPVETLAKLLATTHFSISNDETRLHLNSALFEWEGERVRMVTTDGHRLSKMEIETPGRSAKASMLIPFKGVQALKRMCDEGVAEGEADAAPVMKLCQSGPNAFFELAGLRFSVKLVDAQFPPYQQVVPEASEHSVRAPRLALADSLRAVSVAASDRTGGVKLTLGGGRIRFESESPESGAGFDEVPSDYDGDEITIGFNARYFLDVLGAIEDEEVVLGISGDLDPAVIRPAGESTQQQYLAVVMPMRI